MPSKNLKGSAKKIKGKGVVDNYLDATNHMLYK